MTDSILRHRNIAQVLSMFHRRLAREDFWGYAFSGFMPDLLRRAAKAVAAGRHGASPCKVQH